MFRYAALICPDGVDEITFEPDGAELPPSPRQAVPSLMGGHRKVGRGFTLRTGRRELRVLTFQNLESLAALRFANAKSDAQLASFFAAHGMLVSDWDVEVGEARTKQALVVNALRLLAHPTGTEPSALQAAIATFAKSPLNVVPELASDFKLYWIVQAKSLWQYMNAEIMAAISFGAALHNCEYCGDFFLTGPMTGRRATAKYCRDTHRVAAHRNRSVRG